MRNRDDEDLPPRGSAAAATAGAAAGAPTGEDAVLRAVRETLVRGHRSLRFPAMLEARFESDQARARQRRLIAAAAVALLTYVGFLDIDQRVMPDAAEWVRQLHEMFSSFVIGGLILLMLPIRPAQREAIYAASAIAGIVVLVSPVLCSQALTARSHVAGLLLIVMLAGFAARLRFRWTLLVCVAAIEASLMVPPGPPPGALLLQDARMFVAGGTLITLMASYALEHQERQSWLNRVMAEQQRIALEHANAQLAELALYDTVTGIYNRRQFETELSARWAAAAQGRQPLSLLIADVDHFKLYNDGYGHPAGDACLRSVAMALQGVALRCGGLAARLGGEEFVLLLPDTGADEAQRIAQLTVSEVAALRLPHRLSPVAPQLTVSVGHASLRPGSGRRPGDLLEAADLALYGAKTGGRNRAAAAPPVWKKPTQFGGSAT